MSTRRMSSAALVLSALGIAALIGAAAGAYLDPSLAVTNAQTIAGIEFLLLGGLLATRRPDNRVGWVFLAAGLCTALMHLLGFYSELGSRGADPRLPLVVPATLIYSFLWLPAFALVPTFGLLYFPTGRLPGPGWRGAWWLVTSGFTLVITWYLLASWDCAGSGASRICHTPGFDHDFPATNPLHVHALDGLLPMWFNVGAILLLIGVLASVASVVVRFRRARGDERQQLKWVAYAVVVAAVLYVTGDLYNHLVAWDLIYLIGLSLIPITVAVAVLKYRLYDIDVVISRTVVFAGLAGFITAVYVGIVVGVGALLGAGDEPNLALSIVATGVVAVAFQPVRERLTRLANRLVFGHRATPYEVLSTFAGSVGETANPGSMLDRMGKLVADGTGADRVFVWLRVDEKVRAASVWPAVFLLEPVPDRELDGTAVFDDFDHVEEVAYDGDLLGAITLTQPRGEALNHTERELLADLAGQAALVLRNLRLTEELRDRIEELHSSRRRLVRAQDDERRRLERDLRDGAQQQLARLTRAVREAHTTAGREGAGKAAELLVQVADDGEAAIRTVRELAHGIYPPVLAEEGLPGALSAQAARAAVPVDVDAFDIGRYDPDLEAAVYFCVLEAVNNAAKYADPSQVTIRLSQSNGHLTFEVSDDGVGFDPTTTAKGHGTTNMADRLDALGGQLTVTGRAGTGTTVTGSIPLAATTSVGAA